MELTAKVTRSQFIDKYIMIWNGGLKLTDKEQQVLHEILDQYLMMVDQGMREPYIGELVFSTKSMKAIRQKLKLSSQGLNNYKAQLKEKGVIKQIGSHYEVHPNLIPQKSITFNFNVTE